MQQHLSFGVAIVALTLVACAEGNSSFPGGGNGSGNGTPTGGTSSDGGNGNTDGGAGAGMTSSMGGDTATGAGGDGGTPVVPACGDGTCNGGELCSSCPADCGSCCGNGNCDPGETNAICPADCPSSCGNGVCDGTDTQANCAQDCGSADCSHDPCSTGGALSPDECNGCPFLVCTSLPQCCFLSWDSDCVAEAQGNPLCSC